MNKIPVAILAATGSVGQRFVQLLDQHPWFQVVALTGSERGHGKPYGEVCRWLGQQAEALGYAECPYDALLDEYEPEALTSNVGKVLEDLREALPVVVGQVEHPPIKAQEV